jgi:hypothetical protein
MMMQQQKPDAQLREAWRNGRWGVSEFKGLPVYLWVKGGDLDGLVIDADLLAVDLHEKSGGKIPYDLQINCPRCAEPLHVSGEKKTIKVHRTPPKRFVHPQSGKPVVQMVVVTVEEAMACSQVVGKTICGARFRITENVLHRV